MSDEEVEHEMTEYFTSRLDGSLGTIGPSAPGPGGEKLWPTGPWDFPGDEPRA